MDYLVVASFPIRQHEKARQASLYAKCCQLQLQISYPEFPALAEECRSQTSNHRKKSYLPKFAATVALIHHYLSRELLVDRSNDAFDEVLQLRFCLAWWHHPRVDCAQLRKGVWRELE